MGNYAHAEVLVTTNWVADHMGDSTVRIVEVDVDSTMYKEGHIEGAVGLDWANQLCDQTLRDILTKSDFEKLCAEAGISKDTIVVFYGDNNNWFACYALWQFKVYGHVDARIMDGGRAKWEAEDRPLVTDVPSYPNTKYIALDADNSIRAFKDDILPTMESSSINLVDVRSPDEFTGKIIAPPGMNETAQRGGRIPGAANIPWGQACNEDSTFKSRDDLEKLYGEKGVTSDKPTVAYCRIGERSSHTWFVIKYLLGHNDVKNYDGSWTEWGNLVATPIEKG